jgi:hypothetical protein
VSEPRNKILLFCPCTRWIPLAPGSFTKLENLILIPSPRGTPLAKAD